MKADNADPDGLKVVPSGLTDVPPPVPNLHPLARLLEAVDWSEPGTFDGTPKTEYDPLRDGPLRYLGYANEVGEAFGAWLFAGGVPLSYAVAVAYVLFDTGDKWVATWKDANANLSDAQLKKIVNVQWLVHVIALERGLDTLTWQLLASVVAPGFTIHTLVALATHVLLAAEDTPAGHAVSAALAHVLAMPEASMLALLNKGLPTALGLATIPFIVHPIDASVHALLNATLRPAQRRFVCSQGGSEAGLPICKRKLP